MHQTEWHAETKNKTKFSTDQNISDNYRNNGNYKFYYLS